MASCLVSTSIAILITILVATILIIKSFSVAFLPCVITLLAALIRVIPATFLFTRDATLKAPVLLFGIFISAPTITSLFLVSTICDGRKRKTYN